MPASPVRRVSEVTTEPPDLASASEASICGIALASRNAGGIMPKPAAARMKQFAKAIDALSRNDIDTDEMSDWYAQAIRALAEKKRKKGEDVVELPAEAEAEDGEPGADVIDLVKVLKERLARNASVLGTAEGGRDVGRPATATRKTTTRRPARKSASRNRKAA